jgi:uncharacterized protein YkwD
MRYGTLRSLRDRIVPVLSRNLFSSLSGKPSAFNGLNRTAPGTSFSPAGRAGRLTTNRNRQKVLGFAAAAVSLVLVSAPFLLNVDSDVVAKAQTVAESEQDAKTAEVVTEMAIADDVIAALNVSRERANANSVARDEQLSDGAQVWAATISGYGTVHNDRSLRAMLDQRSGVGEFVIAARTLALAYERLANNPAQNAQLMASTTKSVGVGVSVVENKTYLVVRFAQ